MITETSITPIKGFSLTVAGEVSAAANWLQFSARCEQLKVFSQVMAGFELIAIWNKIGLQQGGDHTSSEFKANSQRGNLLTHDQVCEQLHQSKSQVYRFMEMANASLPRLRKLPALKDFNPTSTPVADLPEAQACALEKAVKKLTSGVTQKEFGESIGLWKKPSGNPNAKGSGQPRKPLTTEEEAALLRKMALEDSGCMGKAVAASNKNFFLLTQVNDLEVNAQIAVLEHALKLRNAWLALPKGKRDPEAIKALLDHDPMKF